MKHKQQGFTLIELLVVLIIMGLMLSVMMPTQSFTTRQKVKVALQETLLDLQEASLKAQKGVAKTYTLDKDSMTPVLTKLTVTLTYFGDNTAMEASDKVFEEGVTLGIDTKGRLYRELASGVKASIDQVTLVAEAGKVQQVLTISGVTMAPLHEKGARK